MKPLLPRLLCILGLSLLLGGCASYDRQFEHGRSLKEVKRFFVVSNLNDNRALDHQIAGALKARERIAEVGPLTMMPEDTQAVITFQDYWTWDFGEHLVFLKINVRDPQADQPYASVTFSSKVQVRTNTPETVSELVGSLLEK